MLRNYECHSRTRYGIHCETDRQEARNDFRFLFAFEHPDLHVEVETDTGAGCDFLSGIRFMGCVRFNLAGAS